MERHLLIESYPWETRAAVLEDDQLVELLCEDEDDRVGNIYKGRIRDVLPGLSCAFIDIGYEKTSFLYVGDLRGATPDRNIADLLKRGQEILVQVKKEEVTGKGARVTTNITIPGHYLVLLPFQKDVSVSRKIKDSQLREELREFLRANKPEKFGLIVRTAAANAPWQVLKEEMELLIETWETIRRKEASGKAPSLVYRDLDVVQRLLRDYADSATRMITVNNAETAQLVKEILGADPIGAAIPVKIIGTPFSYFGLEGDLTRLLRDRVWLKSGGFIIIEETEAMTVVDVNSGKYTGKREFEETVLKINLEAAAEIPRQLRLRGIGGIILIDFIDMKEKSHRDDVIQLLSAALAKDKTHTRVLGITKLGLVEMTRKKSRAGLAAMVSEDCQACHGRGTLRSPRNLWSELLRRLMETAQREGPEVTVEVHSRYFVVIPDVEAHLAHVRAETGKQFNFIANDEVEDYRILP